MLEQKRSEPDDHEGEQAALDLLASGALEIEGRLVDASNATLYCTIRTTGRSAKANPKAAKAPGTRVACVYKTMT